MSKHPSINFITECQLQSTSIAKDVTISVLLPFFFSFNKNFFVFVVWVLLVMALIPQIFGFTFEQVANTIVRDEEDEESFCTGACFRNWKIIFCVLLFVEGLIFGHVVFLVRRLTSKSRRTFDIATHFGHALSAGVFFAAGLLHILPEAIAFLPMEHGSHGEEEEHGESESEHHEDHQLSGFEEEQHSENEHSEGEHSSPFPWVFFIVMVGFYFFFFVEKILLPKVFGDSFHVHSMQESPGMADEDPSFASGAEESATGKDGTMSPSGNTEKPGKGHQLEGNFLSVGFLVALLQILGLSAHSLFESMALGLSTDFTIMLNVFIATASHRWVTSIAIAFTIASKLKYFPFLVVFFLFSAMVPIGVGIGAALTDLSAQVRGVLFSLSAATFIYIGVFETMSDEFVVHREMLARKFVATLAGATLITVITAILIATGTHH